MRASLEGLTFHVLDLERSREFYARIPGAVLEAHRPGEFALFRIGSSHLGLLQSKTSGLHLEVNTPDVDDYYDRLVKAGIERQELRGIGLGASARSTSKTLTAI